MKKGVLTKKKIEKRSKSQGNMTKEKSGICQKKKE